MPAAIKKLELEKGMYDKARELKLSFTKFLHTLEPGDIAPGEKRSSLSQLDAFEKQLAAHEIRVSGKQVSLVEEFYKTSSSTALFPEFINREVLAGMEVSRNECMIADLVANTRTIDSVSYQGISAAIQTGEKGAYRVGEAGEFPKTVITFAGKAVTLTKFGHKIEITYEVLRRMAVDALAVHLRLIGRALRRSMVDDALYTIINGDGNSNPATVVTASGLTYNNLIDFDQEFDDFSPTTWVATKAGMKTLLKLPEFKDPQAGFNYQKTGNMIDPLGVTLRRSKGTYPAANTLIGIDRTAAIEFIVEEGSQLTEVDKVISKQVNESVISQVAGFSKLYTAASQVWNYA